MSTWQLAPWHRARESDEAVPAALPLKKASGPPLRQVLSTVSSRLLLLVIRLSRIFSKGAVAVFDTAPAPNGGYAVRSLVLGSYYVSFHSEDDGCTDANGCVIPGDHSLSLSYGYLNWSMMASTRSCNKPTY